MFAMDDMFSVVNVETHVLNHSIYCSESLLAATLLHNQLKVCILVKILHRSAL